MPLVPKLKDYIDSVSAQKPHLISIGFKPNQTTLREAIANLTAKFMTDRDTSINSTDDVIVRDGYNIPVRIYASSSEPQPVAIFFHGGGHMTGGITVYDNIVRKLTKNINHIVVSIEYRLAPEFAYPTGILDCKQAVENIFDILDSRDIKYSSKDLTIIGDSAGGAICATIASDRDFTIKNKIANQVLIYPSLDYTETSPTIETYGEGYLLEITKLKFYFASYFQNGEDRKEVSPLYKNFYREMPQTLIIAAEYDPLNWEAKQYHAKMLEIGASTEFLQMDGVVHPYIMLEDLCKNECELTYKTIKEFLNYTITTAD
ncbi:MAG: hypothetical protein RL154_1303 [Pseudomonadota bacterium]